MNPHPELLAHLEQFVIELISRHQRLAPGVVTLDSTFGGLGVDDFDATEIILECEETFDVSLPRDMARHGWKVRDMAAALRREIGDPDTRDVPAEQHATH